MPVDIAVREIRLELKLGDKLFKVSFPPGVTSA